MTSEQREQGVIGEIVRLIRLAAEVDAVYLYGSRARGTALEESDFDVAVLFSEYLADPIERSLRPQKLEAMLERELSLYDRVSVVDLELAPPPLQHNITRGVRLFDRGVPHVRRIEYAVMSRIEKDYGDAARQKL